MSLDLKPLVLPAVMAERLPLGYRVILIGDDVLDDDTTRRLAVAYPKYRHVTMSVVLPKKPISKVEL